MFWYRWVGILALSLALLFVPELSHAKSKQSGQKQTITYVVKKGDSIDRIAKRYEVRVEDVIRWNNLQDASRIRIGQKLRIRVPQGSVKVSASPRNSAKGSASSTSSGGSQVVYVVKKGDTLGKIARRTGTSIDELKRLNRSLRKAPDRLRTGQQLVIGVKRFEGGTGVSRGLANNGSLSGGVQLGPGPGYVVRDPKRSYGTALTIGTIMDAMAAYAQAYPKGARFMIGDLSRKEGGKFPPHVSHQSGRDVDISYISKGDKNFVGFQRMNASNFDVEKNWFLFEYFIKTRKVQYIFVDYSLQSLLYAHARSKGYSEQELRGILQYPNGKKSYLAIIRHAKGHVDHSHVRFICASSDIHCR